MGPESLINRLPRLTAAVSIRAAALSAAAFTFAACTHSMASTGGTAPAPAAADMSTMAPNPDPRVGLKAGIGTPVLLSGTCTCSRTPGRRKDSTGRRTRTWRSTATTSFRGATTGFRSGTSPTRLTRRSRRRLPVLRPRATSQFTRISCFNPPSPSRPGSIAVHKRPRTR